MIKGTIDSYELWQSRPENLNENMEDPIESAENRGWNQCNRSWIKTIEEQPNVGEWIPCSEKLPKEYGEYLCTLQGIHDNGTAQQCTFSPHSENEWSTCDADGFVNLRSDEVVAWMPLPEAYKVSN